MKDIIVRKLWSISTTVRNPERIRDFLKVLKLLEGKPFNSNNQEKFQILLIQHKLYFPTNIPTKYQNYYDNPELKITYNVAEEIFYFQNYEDPAMRGRQSVNPLNKLGFSIAREREGNIIITELGNRFIAGDYDIGYIFFKSLLKLQFPNPWSDDFSEKYGFDVMPFTATMHLINKVNKLSDKKGLTKIEFSLFVPSLINYKLINKYVKEILEYRKSKNKENFIKEFAKEFYQEKEPSKKQINNFFEYGDNTMRYFRLTRYFRVATDSFGADWRIDLEPTRTVEINQLLKLFNGQSLKFATNKEYLFYISDILLPKLPSEDIENLIPIAESLVDILISFVKSNNLKLLPIEEKYLSVDLKNLSKNELDKFITNIRQISLELKERQTKITIVNNVDKLQSIIDNLRNYKTIRKFIPEQFEKIIADALKIINDEIKIKPNYPVDDNGEPISHAASNKPDIECYYSSFNAICEVTLDVSNFQWIRESQPVMRHLRDFENNNKDTTNYCLFIAPKIHNDTLSHYWFSIKHGYDGAKQQIIPLTTEQFAILLEILLELIQQGKRFSHKEIEDLYRKIIFQTNSVTGHSEWFETIPEVIKQWKSKITV